MMEKSGALTKLTAGVGTRWFTITAWENLEDVAEMRRTNQAHKEAMHAFFNTDFGLAVHTSVWVPHHIGPIWVRCLACRKPADYERSQGVCPHCRELLPEPLSYW